jgi:RNA polymerase sigma-70 factor (ECF subfamily)
MMSDRSLHFPWEATTAAVAFTEGISDMRDSAATQVPAFHSDSATLDLETVYRIRRPDVIRHLASFGVDLVDAEDITQEVFLQMLGSAGRQKQPDNLFHWALTCARNLAIDRFRRRRKELPAPAALWKQWEDTLPDSAASAEVYMNEKDSQLQLARAMAQLSALEQQCLVFRSRGVTFRQMALALDLSMQSAVYTTDVAIQKLQRKLKCSKHHAEVS